MYSINFGKVNTYTCTCTKMYTYKHVFLILTWPDRQIPRNYIVYGKGERDAHTGYSKETQEKRKITISDYTPSLQTTP